MGNKIGKFIVKNNHLWRVSYKIDERNAGSVFSHLQMEKRKTVIDFPLKRVEDIGVEPTTSCMPCKRSSQLS